MDALPLPLAAQKYAERGYAVFQCKERGKTPATPHGFRDATTDVVRVAAAWRERPAANIGIATGKPSGVFAVDVDEDAGAGSLAELERRYEALPRTLVQETGRGRHLLFRYPKDFDVRNSAGKLGKGLDVRGDGGYVVVAPSVHPSGVAYQWVNEEEPIAEAPPWLLDLLRQPALGAEEATSDDCAIPEGQRNDFLYRRARSLKRKGLSAAEIRGALLAVNATRCQPSLPEAEVEAITANAMRQPDRDRDDDPGPPDMSLLHENRRPAPPFPLDIFPPSWRRWLSDSAESCGAPIDYVVAPLFAASAAVIGNSRWVSPWPGWSEPPIVWIAEVGAPSSGKSPARDSTQGLLSDLEAGQVSGFAATLREFEARKLEAKALREEWERRCRAAVKDGGPAETLPADAVEPEPPQRPRIVLNDATPEAAARILASAPRGVLSSHEELAGWFGNFDKYGGQGGEQAFWIQAFGARPYIIDRVKQAGVPIVVRFLSISVEGGIQPDRLASLFDADDDGLVARVEFFWPEPVPPRRPSRRADSGPALAAFRRLLNLQMSEDEKGAAPVIMPLDDAAATTFQAWRESHVGSQGEASGMFLSWLGKQPGYVLRLALLFQLLDWSMQPQLAVPAQVSVGAVGRAIRLVDQYLKPMAERVFGDAALPAVERNAAKIARLIFARRLGRERDGAVVVNAREIQREKLPALREAAPVNAALNHLVDAGWLRPAFEREGGAPGRRRADYIVNLAIWNAQVEVEI